MWRYITFNVFSLFCTKCSRTSMTDKNKKNQIQHNHIAHTDTQSYKHTHTPTYRYNHGAPEKDLITARCYASAVLAMGLCLSLRPSVRPSVTSRSSTKTAKLRITKTTPHESPGTLVFWSQRSPRNSTGVTPYGGTKCRWGGSKSATFHK